MRTKRRFISQSKEQKLIIFEYFMEKCTEWEGTEAHQSCTPASVSLYGTFLMLKPQYMYIQVCQFSTRKVIKVALKKKDLKCLHIYNQGNIHILQRSQHEDHEQRVLTV